MVIAFRALAFVAFKVMSAVMWTADKSLTLVGK